MPRVARNWMLAAALWGVLGGFARPGAQAAAPDSGAWSLTERLPAVQPEETWGTATSPTACLNADLTGDLVSFDQRPDLESMPASSGLFGRARWFGQGDEDCPTRGLYAFVGYDSWRGVADDSWQNNGLHTGANLGTRLGKLSEWTGIGFQVGGSFGVYDWLGTEYRIAHNDVAQTQGFMTYGFFRRPNEHSGWTGAIVQDWMFNYNFGALGQNPTLGQLRWQLGYAIGSFNELGMWGTVRDKDDSRFIPGYGARSYRAVNQFSMYWHHKWGLSGPDSYLWVGMPEHDRLSGSGTLGDYVVGLSAFAPFSDYVSLYTIVTYMHASAAPGPVGSIEDDWMFGIGLAIYPAATARGQTISGRPWMPLLPVANNGYFMVDTNRTY